MKEFKIDCLLFDKLIDYLKYKNANFSEWEWRENGFRYVEKNYLIKEINDWQGYSKVEIRTNDMVNPDNRICPYARFFFWYYTKAKEDDRCYLNEYAVFDKIFFVYKRKDELTFSPVGYFETKEEADKYVEEHEV